MWTMCVWDACNVHVDETRGYLPYRVASSQDPLTRQAVSVDKVALLLKEQEINKLGRIKGANP